MKKIHLDKIFGPENVLVDEAADFVYSTDASQIKGNTLAVVFPKTPASVQRLVLYATRNNISLVPRGGGTGLVGGAVPNGAIVVDFSRMTKVFEFNHSEKTVRIEPGVILSRLNEYFKKYDLFFPVIPSSEKVCTLGGMIATNAVGLRALRYGRTQDNVIEVDFIDGSGKMYSSSDPFIFGNEGTLGFIVGAKINLSRVPFERSLDVLESDDLNEVLAASEVFSKKENVAALEFLDKETSKQLELPSKYHLIVEYVDDSGSIRDEDQISEFWDSREGLRTIQEKSGYSIIEDPEIPLRVAREFITWCESKKIPVFAHIGVGIFHLAFELNRNDLIKEMQDFVKSIGGKPSGEHGIGLTKKEFISDSMKEHFMLLKNKYDPYNIMNPGKIVGTWTNVEWYNHG